MNNYLSPGVYYGRKTNRTIFRPTSGGASEVGGSSGFCSMQEDVYSQLILDSGPVAYYKCDDSNNATFVTDYSGNDFHGGLVGNIADSFGGPSLRLGASSAQRIIKPVIGSDYWTVPSQALTNVVCIEGLFSWASGLDTFLFSRNNGNTPRLEIFYYVGANKLAVSIDGGAQILSDTAPVGAEFDKLHHILVQYDLSNNTSTMYIDGIAQSDTYIGNFMSTAAGEEARVGARKFSGSYSIGNSRLSDVAFYDRVLSQTEIDDRVTAFHAIADIEYWNYTNKSPSVGVLGTRGNVASISDPNKYHTITGAKSNTTGKKYFEFVFNINNNQHLDTADTYLGIGDSNVPIGLANLQNQDPGGSYHYSLFRPYDGRVYTNSATQETSLPAVSGDAIGVAVDFDVGKVWFSVNGVFSGDPVAGTGEDSTFTPNTQLFPLWHNDRESITFFEVEIEYCQGRFQRPLPSGYTPWV